ncbi:hypothetical protein VTN49DRAFT_5403 [Thermomyces lanuginosus]|uniref:uncharacterized protein n=1 Tax=Thermomyces lanuginosus TaxID=5541 RepID=UPI003743D34F
MHGHAAASQYGLQQPLPEVWGQQDEFRATPPPPYTERSGHSTMVEPSSLAQEQSSRSKRPRVLLKLRIVPLFHITVSLKPWNIRNNMTSPNRVTENPACHIWPPVNPHQNDHSIILCFWVRELDGSYSLRTPNDIVRFCQPGKWETGRNGYPYFIRLSAGP